MRIGHWGRLGPGTAALLALAVVGCAGAPAPQAWQKPGWTLTFHDEFDGGSLDHDKWCTNYRANPALPAHYVVYDGVLHLRMNRDLPPPRRPGSNDRVSGIETRSAGKPFAQQYGWFEIRARCAPGSGTQSAFWLSPLDSAYHKLKSDGGTRADYREAGEIDIFEQHGREPNGNNFNIGYSHNAQHQGTEPRHVQFPFSFTTDFHVFACEWSERAVIWYIDGLEVHRSNKVPHTPFFVRLSLYEGDDLWRGKVNPNDPYPRDFEIDYVRVYEAAP
jgi:beta-glucanase (GH16 family)